MVSKMEIRKEWDGYSIWIDNERGVEVYRDGLVVLRKGEKRIRLKIDKLFGLIEELEGDE